MHDRRKLRDGISASRRIERDRDHLGRTLEHVDAGAVGNISEASRSACIRERPGQCPVAARARKRARSVGGIGIDVTDAAEVTASQRVIIEQNRQIGAGERSCIGDADGQRSGGRVAVAIGDRVSEGIGDIARGAAVAGIAVAAIRIERERAILAGGGPTDRARTAKAGDAGHCAAIGADRIRARRITVGTDPGQHVADRRTQASACHRVGIVRQDRRVVVNGNREIAGRGNGVAVAVGGGQQRAELDQQIVLVGARRMVKLRREREGPVPGGGIKRKGENRGGPGFCGDHIAGHGISKRDAARGQPLRRQAGGAGRKAISERLVRAGREEAGDRTGRSQRGSSHVADAAKVAAGKTVFIDCPRDSTGKRNRAIVLNADSQRGRGGRRTVTHIDRDHQVEAVFDVRGRVIDMGEQRNCVVAAGIDGHRDHRRRAGRAGQRTGTGTGPDDRDPVGGQRRCRRTQRVGERFAVNIGCRDRAGCRCTVGGVGPAGCVRIGKCQPFFGHCGGSRQNHRRVVGAVDGDGQRRSRGIAVLVGDRVGKGLAQRFAGIEPLHRGQRIVERVGVGAVGVERDRAIGSGQCRSHGAACDRSDRAACCRTIGADAVRAGRVAVAAHAGQHIAGRAERPIFGYRIGIVRGGRRVIIDIDRECAGRTVTVRICDGVVQGEALVVLVSARRMNDRGELGHGICAGRRVERHRHDLGGALEHFDPGAISDIAEARRSARSRQRPGQRTVAARGRERARSVSGVGVVADPAGIAASERVVVEQDRRILAGLGLRVPD